jgi:UDP-GlcNAc:undecaprenyl-phosphate GlcNAc-1-phosphate transferase
VKFLSASIASFFVACAMLFALRPLAESIGLIDKPGGRKTHHGDVPVVGGIAMFTGLIVASLAGPGLPGSTVGILVVAAFMVALGVLDDRFNLPPNVRLFAHLSAAVALVYGMQDSVGSLGNLFGTGPVGLGILALPFTVVAIVALVNAFNMLDGLDGLAGTSGLIAFGGIMYIARGDAGVLLVAGSMFGAVAAFLVFNLPLQVNSGIRTFMGDAGSTLLGFVLAGLSLRIIQPPPEALGFPPILILWLMPIPIFELFTSTFRRLIRGIPPSQADNGHYHHVLVRAGFSVRAVCTLYALVSLACCLLGIWAWRQGLSEPLLFGGFLLMFAAWVGFVRNAEGIGRYLPAPFRRVDRTPRP